MSKAALITLAIGGQHFADWRAHCSASWQAYAQKHAMDLVVVTEPLDQSTRAAARSPAWQKCIVFDQPITRKYDRLVLIDSDIVINPSAPSILEQAPEDKIGGVISGSHISADLRPVLLGRLGRGPTTYERGSRPWRDDQNRFYEMYGLSPLDEGIIQTGVLVASQERHAGLFRGIYDANYPIETRGYEQIPLSHAILTGGLFCEIDTRFNSVFYETMLVHFPFLLKEDLAGREQILRHCVGVEHANNFFLHFAYDRRFMQFAGK